MDLKAKLRLIEKQQIVSPPPSPKSLLRPIEQVVSGEICETSHGTCFVHRERFPLAHFHGSVPLTSALEVSAQSLAYVAKDPRCGSVKLFDTVFLDTETTGLSGGAGTCAFLIGLGYFSDGEFTVEQYFMRDFDEEHACLHLVNERISHSGSLVSFNGKSFDVPILKSRTVTGRLEPQFDSILHIDLLYVARRLWKHRLESCSLAHVERHVLGYQRHGDISGELVPQLYFDYLSEGDAWPLAQVFVHNRDDILSLVTLAAKACQTFEQPSELAARPEDILAVGKTFEAMKQLAKTAELYESLLHNQASPTPRHRHIALRLAACYKRLGRWNEALRLWEEAIRQGSFDPLPYVEMAKYYEHRLRNYAAAREIVQRAVSALEVRDQLEGRPGDVGLLQELTHRLRRVERKLSRDQQAGNVVHVRQSSEPDTSRTARTS